MQLKPARRRKPPAHLKPPGAKFWRQVVDEYQVEDSAGMALATCAAECLDRMRAAQEAIEKHGEIVIDRYGSPKLNPACSSKRMRETGSLSR